MGPFPFALSASHFISSVGSDAGFAAIIGLAVLVLLYFAQARETASLRDRAEESAARVQQLEARIAQLAQLGRQAAGPVPAPPPPVARPLSYPVAAASPGPNPNPAAAPSSNPVASANPGVGTAGSPGAQAVPAPPAGVGAPALTAATRLIPTPIGQAAPLATHSVVRGPAVPTSNAPSTAEPAPPAPATAAGGSNGSGQQPRVIDDRPFVPAQPRPRVQLSARGGAPSRSGAPRSRIAPGWARWLTIGGIVLGIVGVIAALLILTSGPSKTPAVASTPTSNAPVSQPKPKPFNYASVTVAVLNGTPTSGLAGRVATRLVGTGYKKGIVATASDQTRTSTVVAYTPGHKADALAVAGTLKLGAGSIQPVDQTTQAVACPPPAACASTVIVTVGSDLTTQ